MKLKLIALVLVAGALISACSGSVKTYYYTLQTAATAHAAAPSARLGIALTSLSLPEVVDRPQLVLHSGDTQLLISDNHLWGQPLKSEIAHSLAIHLARESAVAQVRLPGQAGQDAADFKIAVDILRFDSIPGKEASIEARWSVLRKGTTQASAGHAVVQEAVTGTGYDALVAAHSRALARLSHNIALDLKP